jgi:hypothetical protein
MMSNYLAQQLIIQPSVGAGTPAPVPQVIQGPLTFNTLPELINRLNVFLIPLASIILFLVLIWGGYDFMMSGGQEDKISAGKAKITTAIIGFVLLVLSYFMARLLGTIFGVGGA